MRDVIRKTKTKINKTKIQKPSEESSNVLMRLAGLGENCFSGM